MLRAVAADALGVVERPLYLTHAMTGLRQGELLALRWSDVDWSASRVRVAESYTRGAFDSPKSHRGRSVLMADPGHVLDASKLRKRFRLAVELERHFQRSCHRGDQNLVFAHPATAARDVGVEGHADASTTEISAHYAPDPTSGAAFAQRAFGDVASPPPLGDQLAILENDGGPSAAV